MRFEPNWRLTDLRLLTRRSLAMLVLAGCALMVALVDGPGALAHTTDEADYAEIDEYLRDRMDTTSTPGMAYAVVSSDSIERMETWGHDGNGDSVTASTPFLWGSIAKLVTATAVMTLVEEGSVSLDEPVRTYLPSFSLADDEVADQITVRRASGVDPVVGAGYRVADDRDCRCVACPGRYPARGRSSRAQTDCAAGGVG